MVLLSFVTSLCALAMPLYTLQLFDRVLITNNRETLVMLLAALVIVGAGYILLDALRRRIPRYIADMVETALNRPLLLLEAGQPLSQPLPENRLSQRLKELRTFFTSPTLLAAVDALWLPLFIALLFVLHPVFGGLALLTNGLLLSAAMAQQKWLARSAAQSLQKTQCQQQSEDALIRCRGALHSMGATQNWLDATGHLRHSARSSTNKLAASHNGFATVLSAVKWLFQAALPTAGALLIIEQQITPGAMIAALIIGFRSLMPFEALIHHWQSLNRTYRTLNEIRHYLDRPTPSANTPPVPFSGAITVSQLSVGTHLRDISFSLAAGQCLAIIGANGAGKSLLLECLLGRECDTGDILFDHIPAAHIDRQWLGRQTGYVPQSIQVPGASLKQHLSRYQSPAAVSDDTIVSLARQVGIHDWVMRLPEGYDTCAGGDGNPLSPGLSQRLAIGRALCGQPQLLVFDEADSALDNEGTQAYRAVIEQALDNRQTVIFVTQKRQLLSLADSVLVLDKGRAVFHGPANQLPQKRQNIQMVRCAGRSS